MDKRTKEMIEQLKKKNKGSRMERNKNKHLVKRTIDLFYTE